MICFLCETNMVPFLSRTVKGDEVPHYLVKCEKCGLVIDKTTYERDLTTQKNVTINLHSVYQGSEENVDDPRWLERLEIQSNLFVQLFSEDVLSLGTNIVDYGCGDGKLSNYFKEKYLKLKDKKYFSLMPQIQKYDKYMNFDNKGEYLANRDMRQNSFDVVVSCSVFEHLIGKKDVDEILGLLNENGTFCLHTLVCEEVPKDPDWFYFLPLHCTIWTNKAMELLYQEYGFIGCAYNIEARMWFLFKNEAMFYKLKSKSKKIDGTWIFSRYFIDYWKKDPYR